MRIAPFSPVFKGAIRTDDNNIEAVVKKYTGKPLNNFSQNITQDAKPKAHNVTSRDVLTPLGNINFNDCFIKNAQTDFGDASVQGSVVENLVVGNNNLGTGNIDVKNSVLNRVVARVGNVRLEESDVNDLRAVRGNIMMFDSSVDNVDLGVGCVLVSKTEAKNVHLRHQGRLDVVDSKIGNFQGQNVDARVSGSEFEKIDLGAGFLDLTNSKIGTLTYYGAMVEFGGENKVKNIFVDNEKGIDSKSKEVLEFAKFLSNGSDKNITEDERQARMTSWMKLAFSSIFLTPGTVVTDSIVFNKPGVVFVYEGAQLPKKLVNCTIMQIGKFS